MVLSQARLQFIALEDWTRQQLQEGTYIGFGKAIAVKTPIEIGTGMLAGAIVLIPVAVFTWLAFGAVLPKTGMIGADLLLATAAYQKSTGCRFAKVSDP